MTIHIATLFVRTSISWLWFAAIAGWALISFAIGSIRVWKRSQNMSAVALELGFTYTAWQGPESAPKFETPLFQNSFGGFKNFMTGSFAGMGAQIFDYSRTTGSQSRTTTTQTVAVYQK